MLAGSDQSAADARRVLEPLLVHPACPTVIAADRAIDLSGLIRGVRTVAVLFDVPPFADRLRLWAAGLDEQGLRAGGAGLRQVANKFVLSAGRIREAAAAAASLVNLRGA